MGVLQIGKSKSVEQWAYDDGTLLSSLSPDDQPDQVSLHYAAGALTASLFHDRACLGPDACTKVAFLGDKHEDLFPFADLPADGILGLGLPSLSYAAQFNILTALANSDGLPSPRFGLFLSDEEAEEVSEFALGGPNPDHIADPEVQSIPVTALGLQRGYWQVPLRGVEVTPEASGRGMPLRLCARSSCEAAVDSGAAGIGVSPEIAKDL